MSVPDFDGLVHSSMPDNMEFVSTDGLHNSRCAGMKFDDGLFLPFVGPLDVGCVGIFVNGVVDLMENRDVSVTMVFWGGMYVYCTRFERLMQF